MDLPPSCRTDGYSVCFFPSNLLNRKKQKNISATEQSSGIHGLVMMPASRYPTKQIAATNVLYGSCVDTCFR